MHLREMQVCNEVDEVHLSYLSLRCVMTSYTGIKPWISPKRWLLIRSPSLARSMHNS